MIAKYAAIQRLAGWDPDAGPGPVEGYRKLDCREWVGETIRCGELTIDQRSGRIRDDLALRSMLVIRDGHVVERPTPPRPASTCRC